MEAQLEAVALFVKVERDVLDVLEDRPVLVLDAVSDVMVVAHGLEPEVANASRRILDSFDVAGADFDISEGRVFKDLDALTKKLDQLFVDCARLSRR